jgi:hypothetical protein
MTEDEARQLIVRLLETENPIRLLAFEHGWVAQETLTPEEQARDLPADQANFVINSTTGVVTAHPSLPPAMIAKQYTVAQADGAQIGRQIWPVVPGPTT